MTPRLTLVPPPPATPADTERAAREEMLRVLGWRATVNPPGWREALFLGRPIGFRVPRVPPPVIMNLRGLRKEAFSPDDVGLKALGYAEGLRDGMPQGAVPRSMGSGRARPPSRDAVSGWNRRAFLAACGPAVVPLLVAAGYLTPGDVEFLDATYPEGMEEQRLAATEASGVVGSAAQRAGERSGIPSWLDDQLWTLMGEPRDTKHFQSLYEPEEGSEQGGAPAGAGVGGGGDSKIANQFRPQPSPGSM